MELDNIIGTGQSKQQLMRISQDNPQITQTLESIFQDYSKCLQDSGDNGQSIEDKRRRLVKFFAQNSDIYHISSRIKSPEHLVNKIINRLYKRRKQYFNISQDNYYKIVTDLLGFKLIHCFPDGWTQIDDLLFDSFYQNDEQFITNYCLDYTSNPKKPFLIEKPLVYYPVDSDISMYKAKEKKKGKNLYQYEPTRAYKAVHYLINFEGVYTEIQVKSMSDDLWGMVDHDLVYKQEVSQVKDVLSDAADFLHLLLSASDAVCMYMKETDRNNIEQADRYINICKTKVKKAVEFYNKKGEYVSNGEKSGADK